MPRKERLGLGLLLAGIMAGTALLLWMPYERAAAQGTTADAVYAGHERHLPPKRGSEVFQYAHPHRRAIAPSDVYDPTPPPPGKSPNGIREYTLTLEEDVPYEVAPGV